MWSLATLHSINDDLAKPFERKAKRNKKAPQPQKIYNVPEVNEWKAIPFPAFGNYTPKGWELVDTLTCYEPYRLEQIKLDLIKHYGQFPQDGYSVSFGGQFEMNIDIWRKEVGEQTALKFEE